MSRYTFPALQGRQGHVVHYLFQCPVRLVPRLFLFDEAEVPPSLRRNHTIEPTVVAQWRDYLHEHPADYVLAPLIAVVDREVIFEPDHDTGEIGAVHIPIDARPIICAGHHLRAAIKDLLDHDETIGTHTIAVMLVPDPDLNRAADIYRMTQPEIAPLTKSSRVLHAHSDLAALVRQLVDETPLFQRLVEREKTTISNRSTALFTLSAVYQATRALLGIGDQDLISEEQARIAGAFWQALGAIIPEWRQIIAQATTAAQLRQGYVHSHTVTLLAIGMAGNALIVAHPADWHERLTALGAIDWSRKNVALWEGRAMVRGKMNKSHDSIHLTASAIKRALGLPRTEREIALEESLIGSG